MRTFVSQQNGTFQQDMKPHAIRAAPPSDEALPTP